VTQTKEKRIQKRRRSAHYFDFQTALFLTLITVYCLERVLSPTIFSLDLTCVGKRTVLLGETALESGTYHALAVIAIVSLGLALLEFALQRPRKLSLGTKRLWALPAINVLAALGLLAIIATPWAYYNVGHPLSDRIYQLRGMIAPSMHFERPDLLRTYSIDPEIWHCDNGPCEGDAHDTISTYHHRFLDVSYRFVLISECMSSEFNLATAKAIGINTTNWNGERRVTARAYFDRDGRFIGPHYKWFRTPLMWSQLTDHERQTPSVSFDGLMNQLSNWSLEANSPQHMPGWVDWTRLENAIKSGEIVEIFTGGDLLIAIRFRDGTELLGTQSRSGDLDRTLEECGADCNGIEVAR